MWVSTPWMLGSSFVRVLGLIAMRQFRNTGLFTTASAYPQHQPTSHEIDALTYLIIADNKLRNRVQYAILAKLLCDINLLELQGSLPLLRLPPLLRQRRPYLAWKGMVVQRQVCLLTLFFVDIKMCSAMVSARRVPAGQECFAYSVFFDGFLVCPVKK